MSVELQLQIILQLVYAAVLGGLIGLERGYHRRPAGLRTYALVAMGAALFSIIALYGFTDLSFHPNVRFDPSRIISQIVVGIGFLGAGIIIFRRRGELRGLTTAAGLWVAAAIGVAVGTKLYITALAATILTLVIFHLLLKMEYGLALKKGEEEDEDNA